MILYGGKIYENSRQDELLRSLEADIYRPIENSSSLPCELVINACDRLAEKVKNGEFDEIVLPFLKTFNIEQSRFEEMVGLFTEESLRYKCSVELCDDEKIIDNKVVRKRYPLGVLLHIAAGNVDVLPAYSVIEGLLSGNINILKLPMGDSGLSVRLLSELISIEPRLGEYIYVFDVPSTETVTLKRLAELSDGIVVWGGDAAVKAARTMAEPNTRIIEWGHKLSFAYAEPDADENSLRELAKAICDTNQVFCSSCQGIFIDTDDADVQKAFAEKFFGILRSVSLNSQPADYGMRAKNALSIYNERLEKRRTGTEIFSGDGVSVLAPTDSELSLSYMYRSAWVKRLPMDKIHTLKKHKNHLQTAAVLTTDKRKREEICKKLAEVGVVRLTSGGKMSRMISGEAHDGRYALREYSRIVETELF